jgi:radical SAM protein with 4Fe4S-binding SPASM domain
MPNILLTNYCNRSCPYCFAKEKVGKPGKYNDCGKLNITLENVDYIIKFLKRSKHPFFSILGGEPTLHPQFTQIVDRALENDFIIRLFSNGLMSREKRKYLFRHNIDMILNINEPNETSVSHQKKLEDLYDNLGPNIHPGFNIYRENFDFSFIFELIERYHMPREIRLGISEPIVSQANKFIAPEQYRKIGKKLVILAEEASRRNIKLNFDCGFVLCMFSKADIGKLVYSNVDLQFVCGPTIDIDPELNVWHCFPLSTIKNKKLKDFKDLKALVDYYEQIKIKYAQVGMFTRCESCIFLKRQQCTGGCISHKLQRYPQIIQELSV